ncbi:hypothetical protein HanRHA438_Chr09g0392131 [Helianthus annuus]|nr:hypothetical protein HanIR_Chr09g0410061 [Helianthus annuus]KAJ0541845.1 hypothetical protein HanHA89_Chr09g0333171 [Helianthus annuus]KAJ0706920.1 hypothetical protein HanLR1_Chr09g0312621 [Helianthus annuus]KAJ0710939.1 hypothetical protein HanOQP8_Chr09g0318191 [Helianthus annuus]KAJ0887552.1 hypothetical protein HanRHA438_Chr09g0392131 [Helianthus annuus]
MTNHRFGDDNLQLIDFSEEDDYLIAVPYRASLEDLRLSVSFDNVNGQSNHILSESVDPRRQSFLRKSLAWDSAFFTSAGVLNHEELFLINQGFKKTESNQPSPTTQKDSKRSKTPTNNGGTACSQSNAFSCKKMNSCPQNKVKSVRTLKGQSPNLQGTSGIPKTRITDHQVMQDKVSSLPKLFSSRQTNNNVAGEGSHGGKTGNKTRKAGTAQDLTASKKFRSGDLFGLPKSISFTSPTTEKNSKLHRSYESSSSASSSKKTLSKFIKRKVNPKNMKPVNSPSSVHHPLSSTCSSNTSPASSIDGWLSESLSSASIPVLDFRSQNSEGRKFVGQKATRSSIGTGPFSGGPKRKIKPSGLRLPSPKIGFFDEEPIFNRSTQDHFGGLSPPPNGNASNKLQLKRDGQTPKEILKMNLDQKRQKDDRGSFQAEKENVCSFEDQVNGLSRQLEVIDLAAAAEHSTPCSRTPLAKKKFGK